MPGHRQRCQRIADIMTSRKRQREGMLFALITGDEGHPPGMRHQSCRIIIVIRSEAETQSLYA
ncbi:hypothetical protein D3C73_1304900 [compost metagenome]